jgi:hypothetical protein
LLAIALMLIFAASDLDIYSLSSRERAYGCRFRTGNTITGFPGQQIAQPVPRIHDRLT